MEKWQTIKEFKKNPIAGWCWIRLDFGSIDVAYFSGGTFCYNDISDDSNYRLDEIWDIEYITHVMPITTPEAPK